MSERTLGDGVWCILELMGDRRLAGFLTEVELAGAGFLRLDIPDHNRADGEAYVSQFYSPSAVYAVTPTTEEVATEVAMRRTYQPLHPWELRSLTDGEDAEGEDSRVELDDELNRSQPAIANALRLLRELEVSPF